MSGPVEPGTQPWSLGERPSIALRQSGGAWRPWGGSDRVTAAAVPGAAPLPEPEAAGPGDVGRLGEDDEPEPAAAGGVLARLTGSAFDPGRPGLRALAVVAVLVVLGAGLLAWWSRPQPEPVEPRLEGTAAVTPTAAGPAVLVVAVTGLVHEPGLVELPPGSRVADAIEAAGGLLPEAEIDHLNLARKLTDGELIAVGVDPPPGDPAGPSGGGSTGSGGKVNLNLATSEELQALPGIGPAMAQRIIDFRTEHGPFTSVGQLRQVSGIGEVRFAELRDLVTV